jgi:4-amino-4-deoxy-L-arabinose transferase-like glycosyltransferase
MINKYKKIILVLIVLLACVLRFWGISNNPPSLNWDEAALGYNAYSLGIDGTDEHGNFLPITALESYGDYKAAFYAYLSIVPVKIFGLNEFSIRFSSALFGTLSVLLTYFVVKELFYSRKKKLKLNIEALALPSALFLAISPWHIMLSRAAFEANTATFFVIGGILFFLLGLNKHGYNFIISALFFAFSMYTFHSERIVVPILLIFVSIFSFKDLVKKKKYLFISAVLGLIMVLPLINYANSPQSKIRYQEVNIFSNLEIIEKSNQKIAENDNALWARIIYNRRVGYGQEFAKHYLDHFKPDFLFITGDENPRFSVREVGQLYIWDALFLIIGAVMLVKLRPGRWYFLPIWIFAGIIPAAIARETPHALRIASVLPAPQIIIAFGFLSFYAFLKSKTKYANLLAGAVLILLLINFLYFINVLFGDYAKKHAAEWQYGYKEVAEFAYDESSNYEKVYVDEEIGRPYIYNLIYNNIKPNEFRKKAVIEKDMFGFINVTRFDNIYYIRGFRDIYDKEPDNLFIKYFNNPESINTQVPANANIVRVFKLPNGNTNFVAYTSSK